MDIGMIMAEDEIFDVIYCRKIPGELIQRLRLALELIFLIMRKSVAA